MNCREQDRDRKDERSQNEAWGIVNTALWRFAAHSGQVILACAFLLGLAIADTRKPVLNPDPEYPEIARRMNINGTVKVEIVIAADGSILSTKVLGGHPVLAESVQKALKKWKYAPGASETTMQLEFKF